eukprot:4998710-Prymnesium_polylepis.1
MLAERAAKTTGALVATSADLYFCVRLRQSTLDSLQRLPGCQIWSNWFRPVERYLARKALEGFSGLALYCL